MNLDDLMESSITGVARFLRHAKELSYNPIIPGDDEKAKDAWTMAYGVGEETYMLVYAVNAGEKKYPTQGTIRKLTGMHGKFDRKDFLEQGRKNVENEMKSGEMSPFVSEHFDISKLHVIIDQACIENNEMVKFPAGNGSYFAMGLKDVLQNLLSLYGQEKVMVHYLFNNNLR